MWPPADIMATLHWHDTKETAYAGLFLAPSAYTCGGKTG